MLAVHVTHNFTPHLGYQHTKKHKHIHHNR